MEKASAAGAMVLFRDAARADHRLIRNSVPWTPHRPVAELDEPALAGTNGGAVIMDGGFAGGWRIMIRNPHAPPV